MKSWMNLVALAVLVGMVILGPLQTEAAMTLKLSHAFAPGSLEDRSVQYFCQQVEKRTNGEIKIQNFPAAQLGWLVETNQGMTLGTIDFTFVDITLLSTFKDHQEFYIGQVPYLFNSAEDARRIYNSDIFTLIYENLRKKKGIRILSVSGDRAPRAINTSKGPIFSPEDCKGIKIRVLPHEISIKTFEAWGFKPTPVSWIDLYMSIKTGVVDGQDNGLDATVPNKFYEVAKYFALSDHVYSIYSWSVSEITWNKVPEKYRRFLVTEAKGAGDYLTKLGGQRQLDDLDTILKAGVKVTIPNRFAFREAGKNVYKDFEGKLWPEGMVEKIRAMQKK